MKSGYLVMRSDSSPLKIDSIGADWSSFHETLDDAQAALRDIWDPTSADSVAWIVEVKDFIQGEDIAPEESITLRLSELQPSTAKAILANMAENEAVGIPQDAGKIKALRALI